ncbi:Circadian clock protein KaiC [Lysobacter dokdonensis DS-58]|uniref:non-specific serine/threonine protein kinase n=1 Tax=Lysobacter dokdonensis DS-58 TaxID=1300345 RepID=A0A0A2WIZ0_9GAMM|nr:ATPase domain-containing protein [Lysobacter dokdonensis]KGQ18210.1 Circadian clock protein KaiC [Lysobacter dokdonensis DS-58]
MIATPIGTGIAGLDTVLGGGYTPRRLYLIEGLPGSGKTTLAMQFLMAGRDLGERVLYVSLSETEQELREMASSHGWTLDGVSLYEPLANAERMSSDAQYTMFHPSEVELADTTQRILRHIEEFRPDRLVFDSLGELRLLSGSPLRYRRQVLALKQYFSELACTTLLLDDIGPADQGMHVHTIVHGVLRLQAVDAAFGGDRRRLRVGKFRGRRFIGGYHDYRIETGGLLVFPRLVASDYRREAPQDRIGTGMAQLDTLFGGGLSRGTSTLLIGAAGTGKSSLATLIACAAADRGERTAIFAFDESVRAFITRSEGLGFPVVQRMEEGLISLRAIDPAELSSGEFTQVIRDAVERDEVRVVVIDSLNGYLNAMPGEQHMLLQLHDLLAYLGSLGIITLLVSAQLGLIGTMSNRVDVSYLADGVVLLRYYEAEGEVRQAISVLKQRTGEHERTIRPFRMSSRGFEIGEPLRELRGVLTGVPQERTPAPDTLRR